MRTRYAWRLVSSIFIAMGALLLVFGLVQADPAHASLSATISNRNPEVGEVLVVTFTLDQMDSEEAFYDWRVRLEFSSTVLTFVPDSCWLNPGVWLSDTFLITSCYVEMDPYSLYMGEGNLVGHSITDTPILLGSARFTVTEVAPFGFSIITETMGDTNFFRPDNSPWQPGIVRLLGPNAVTLQNLIARSGAGVVVGAGLGIVAGIALRRKRNYNRP